MEYKIPLMRNPFSAEASTRDALASFILKTDRLSMGPQCKQFEDEFAKWQGARYAVLFNSGGSANLAMLQALKNSYQLSDCDNVGYSALTWATNVMPIIQLGMNPVPVDCYHDTLNISPQTLLERIRGTRLDALFITNALGFAAELQRIREICYVHGILLIEDNCESLGTVLHSGRTGNFGAMSSFSFYVAHQMSTIEGGMVVTDDDDLADMLRMVRANGWDRDLSPASQQWLRGGISEFDAKYTFYCLGYNLRPTEITGALGLEQLKHIDATIAKRQENYLRLEKVALANPDLFCVQHDHIQTLSSFAFPVICKDRETRDRYLQRFDEAGIETRRMIGGSLQDQPFYRKSGERRYDLPGTEEIDACGFYCGNYPELTDDDLAVIERCLK